MRGDWTKIARHTILTMGLYTFAESIKSLIEGKTIEDPTSFKFAAKALANSGAAGIIGDTILSEMVDKNGARNISNGLARGALGPGANTVIDAAGVLLGTAKMAFDDKARFPGSDLGKLVTQNIPFQNLFYTKAAYNYYFANGLREAMGPGFLGNLERGVAQTPGMLEDRQRYFMFRPSESFRWPNEVNF